MELKQSRALKVDLVGLALVLHFVMAFNDRPRALMLVLRQFWLPQYPVHWSAFETASRNPPISGSMFWG